MSRMFTRFERGELAIGATMMEHGTEWMDILGYVGVDWAMADMMNSSLDWGAVADMVRACDRYDVTPWVRLQAYPWGGLSDYDPRLPADVFRAIGLGAEGVVASVNTAEAVASMLVPLKEDNEYGYVHTRPYINRPLDGLRPERRDDDRSGNRWVIPNLESLESLQNLDSILEVDGLRGVVISLADLSQAIGRPFDYRSPELDDIVRETTTKCARHDVIVFAFAGGDTPEYVAESVRRLGALGVRGCFVPRMTFAAQRFYERVLREVDETARKPSTPDEDTNQA